MKKFLLVLLLGGCVSRSQLMECRETNRTIAVEAVTRIRALERENQELKIRVSDAHIEALEDERDTLRSDLARALQMLSDRKKK